LTKEFFVYEYQGILAVLVAVMAWGSYTVPLKRATGLSPFWFQIWCSVGIGISSLALGAWRGFPSFSPWGVLGGLFWSVGAACSFLAVQKEGLSGASTRWMGTGILVSFLSGVFLLGEPVHFLLAFPGILLLIAGLFLVSRASPPSAPGTAKSLFANWRSIVAGVIFGAYLLPLQIAKVESMDFVAPMGLGILGGAFLIWIIFRPKSSPGMRVLSMGCGLAWNFANLGSLIAVQSLGMAVGFPLTQLALLVSIAWGVFVFKEAPLPSQKRFLALAALTLLVGAALLGISRG
jgi:glucose uptake protein